MEEEEGIPNRVECLEAEFQNWNKKKVQENDQHSLS